MSKFIAIAVALCHLFVLVQSVYQGSFQNEKWHVSGNAMDFDKSLKISILIGVEIQNRNKLEVLLHNISSPTSPNYLKYLGASEIASITSPRQTDLQKLMKWLKQSEGDISINNTEDLILLKASVENLEQLFSTKLKWFENIDAKITQNQYVRAIEDISVPEDIKELISFISINSPIITKQGSKSSKQQSIDQIISSHQLASDINAEKMIAPLSGDVLVYGGQDAALLRFSFHCWANQDANSLCGGDSQVSSVEIKVENIESAFPPTKFQVPFESLFCTISGQAEKPCNPMNQSSVDCLCALVVGPLPKYSKLSFSVSGILNQQSEKVMIASSPSPVTLLDIVTPSLLRELYNIPYISMKNGATLAVAEFSKQFYSNQDLDFFFSSTGITKEDIPEKDVIGNSPNDPSSPGGEAMLDIEYLMALAPNSSLSYYSVGDCSPFCEDEDFLLWLFYIGSQKKPEMVHSVSYADSESVDHNATAPGSVDFFNRIDIEFMKLGLQGSTVIVASGDNGVCSFTSPSNPKGCSQAQPTWPASSPYVTAVGATQLSDKYIPVCGQKWSNTFDMFLECSGVGEVVCQSDKGGVITPGGGFSNVYDRPWWQKNEVSKFLETGQINSAYPSTQGFFNQNERGFPDVAVHGAQYLIVDKGQLVVESGTSASTPVFASMISLINDMRAGNGLPPLGFVNPLLYHLQNTHPKVFNDVTVGNNACRAGHQGQATSIDCNDKYFGAAPGWDPVTGLGSIDFGLFSQVVLKIGETQIEAQEMASPSTDNLVMSEDTPTGKRRIGTIDPFGLEFFLPMLIALMALGVAIHSNVSLKRNKRGNFYGASRYQYF